MKTSPDRNGDTAPRTPAERQRATLTPGRRKLFIAVTLLFPVVFLLLLESSLRLLHYGPNLSLVIPEVIGDRTYYVMNPEVKARYFARVPFSPSTSTDFFQLPKPPGTYRIFCLGGSTTVGYPYWYNGSFAAFLRDRLRAMFPDRQIEVINMGMTATNSFTTLDFARELIRDEPDLFVVYDGHNEFYGALGAASNETVGVSRSLTTLYLRLIHLRTFLLLRDAYNRLASMLAGPGSFDPHATMMEKLAFGHYVPYGSSVYRDALASFEGNLQDLSELCREHRVPVLLGSQASNLRDQPPFVSGDAPGATPEERINFSTRYREAVHLEEAGRPDSALTTFRQLLGRDSIRADLHYQIARCLDTLGRKAEARREYVRARDDDELRFRASSDFNEALRAVAKDSMVIFADIEKAFQENSPDSLIGDQLIVEHLHPNARGNFLIARKFVEEMRRHGLLATPQDWASRDTIDDRRLWDDRNLTELDEIMARRVREVLTSGWPFKPQVPIVPAVPENDTLAQIAERMTRGQWAWDRAHAAAADYYHRRGQLDMAAKEYRVIIAQIPLDVTSYLKLALLLYREGKTEEMRRVLTASLHAEPTSQAYRMLGDLALTSKNPREAIVQYEKLWALDLKTSERADAGYVLALAYLGAEMPEPAIAKLTEVLRISPDDRQAQTLLTTIRRIQAGKQGVR